MQGCCQKTFELIERVTILKGNGRQLPVKVLEIVAPLR